MDFLPFEKTNITVQINANSGDKDCQKVKRRSKKYSFEEKCELNDRFVAGSARYPELRKGISSNGKIKLFQISINKYIYYTRTRRSSI